MTPDRVESAASECEALAANPAPTDKDRQLAHNELCWVPDVHPERHVDVDGRIMDRVLDVAEKARKGTATPDELRAMAASLRAGAAEMAQTGWYKSIYGGGL
jgi:hypothetical protein